MSMLLLVWPSALVGMTILNWSDADWPREMPSLFADHSKLLAAHWLSKQPHNS